MFALAIFFSFSSLISSGKRVKDLPLRSLKHVSNIVDSIVFTLSLFYVILVLGILLVVISL